MKIFTLTLFIFLNFHLLAQKQRETRAVWVATNYHLDWPPQTFDEAEQRYQLRNIFSDINNKKLNTIYFQVRSSGTVMFKSSYEPFSPYFTGETGEAPNYDPLKLAIRIAHKKGLELHAWFNVMRCFSGNEKEILSNPNHIANKHPDWVIEYSKNGKSSLWLDPGLPAVRNYLINIIAEAVSKYDLDGIHLDFLRYPGNKFNDDFSFNLYGSGKDRAEWRRNNLTKFMAQLFETIRRIKPYVKIGATPFGIYKNLNNATGTQGYSNVYQDTRLWLKLGYIDYAVPQIYWNMNDNPKFDVLATDWTNNSFNKNIILGIAAYKPEVKSELGDLIKYSRLVKAAGIAFFRYKNIKNYKFKQFKNRAYPSTLPGLINRNPLPPINLEAIVSSTSLNQIKLKWELPNQNSVQDSIKYYALYRLKKPGSHFSAANLYDIFEADKTSVVLSIKISRQIKYYFALKSVDKLWNESEKSSNIVEAILPGIKNIAVQMRTFDKPLLIKNIDDTYNLMLYSTSKDSIQVLASNDESPVEISSLQIFRGKNIFTLPNNLVNYSSLVIKFINSGKQVKLKL